MPNTIKTSKKLFIPIIIISVFIIWLILWIFYFQDTWNNLNAITRWFYIGLLLPWVIIILYILYGRITLDKEIGLPKYQIEALNIPSGMVRIFLIATVFFVYFYYIVVALDNVLISIPNDLLIIINAIIAYFGFNTKNVLPEDHVIEVLPEDVPKNGELLNSLPPLKDALNDFQKIVEKLLDELGKMVIDTINQADNFINICTEKLGKLSKIIKNIPSFQRDRDKFFRYGAMLILIFLVILNLMVPDTQMQTFVNLGFSMGGLFLGFLGTNSTTNEILKRIENHLTTLETKIAKVQTDLQTYKATINTFKQKATDRINEWFKEFKESNFLSFLPSNYSSILSMSVVSFISLSIFLISLPVPMAFFSTMQWFILYYFINKRK